MVGQMSANSIIYHRAGCSYINRINANSLVTFDLDDGRIENLKPCKSCCSLKGVYERYKPQLRNVFEDLIIDSEFDGEYVSVHTAWYEWKIWLKPSSQNIKLYREECSEKGEEKNLVRVYELDNSKSIAPAMKYIADEERVAAYPVQYRRQALKIEQYAREKNVAIEFDGTDLYILTDMAAWKIAYGYHYDWYKLLHCPFDEGTMTMQQAKEAHYHVQKDVPRNQSPFKHLQYIVKHDLAKKIESIDFKRLPQKTKKQKKYYKQAKNRARRKSVSRVYDIFAELEDKSDLAKVSYC